VSPQTTGPGSRAGRRATVNDGPAVPVHPHRRADDRLHGTAQVRELTGLTARELDYAVQRGWLTPIAGPRGSGLSYRWSNTEVRTARVFASLRRAGIAPEVAAEVARRVVASGRRDGHGVALVPGVDLVVLEDDLTPAGHAATAPVFAGLGRQQRGA